ncbi:WSC-domain-containing protein [Gigaspora margarita]|uniref:WSC-domain-containing protein n=1 Tax=Gigaspora margarita TaxID=4874 RepID=A0A8H4AX73_GIGMA|nr:WSC-domain-containing protein [Gigaspora margarita]
MILENFFSFFGNNFSETLYNLEEKCVGNLIQRDYPTSDPLGCYVNVNSTVTFNGLSDLNISDPYMDQNGLMDPGLCITHCTDYLFKFVALSNGTECRCGKPNSLQGFIKVNDTNCNITCVGNSSYICGGVKSYIIYDAETSFPSHKPPNITINEKLTIINNLKNDGLYLGCIKESPYCNQRMFNGTSQNLSNMTIDRCIEICEQNNFKYVGLEIGTQCFCTNNYNNVNQLDMSECSSSCGGNNSQICGGPLAISVYNISKLVTNTTNMDSTKNGTNTILISVLIIVIVILIVGLLACFRRIRSSDNIDNGGEDINLDNIRNRNLDKGEGQNLDYIRNRNLDEGEGQNLDNVRHKNLDESICQNLDNIRNKNLDEGEGQNLDNIKNRNLDEGKGQNLDKC